MSMMSLFGLLGCFHFIISTSLRSCGAYTSPSFQLRVICRAISPRALDSWVLSSSSAEDRAIPRNPSDLCIILLRASPADRSFGTPVVVALSSKSKSLREALEAPMSFTVEGRSGQFGMSVLGKCARDRRLWDVLAAFLEVVEMDALG